MNIETSVEILANHMRDHLLIHDLCTIAQHLVGASLCIPAVFDLMEDKKLAMSLVGLGALCEVGYE